MSVPARRRLRRYVANGLWQLAVNEVAASRLLPRQARAAILRSLGMELDDVWVFPGCFFSTRRLRVGPRSWINQGCFFENNAPIEIGPDCGIAMEAMLCTTTHRVGEASRRPGIEERLPIRVGAGCWIGARAVVLPGVTIGDGCVIAAGAVVSEDCEPHGLYAGVPARRIRELPAQGTTAA